MSTKFVSVLAALCPPDPGEWCDIPETAWTTVQWRPGISHDCARQFVYRWARAHRVRVMTRFIPADLFSAAHLRVAVAERIHG